MGLVPLGGIPIVGTAPPPKSWTVWPLDSTLRKMQMQNDFTFKGPKAFTHLCLECFF